MKHKDGYRNRSKQGVVKFANFSAQDAVLLFKLKLPNGPPCTPSVNCMQISLLMCARYVWIHKNKQS